MMLTKEQRYLLAGTDPGMLTITILDPLGGITQIKSRQGGGHLRQRDGCPEWLTVYDTTNKGYVGREHFGGDVRVTVTWAQLKDFVRDIPAGVKDRLRVVRDAELAESDRAYGWCHCHHGDLERAANCEERNRNDPLWGGRTHPSDAEYEDHLAIVFDLRDKERDLLMEALGLVAEPVGQLDMFDLMGVNE